MPPTRCTPWRSRVTTTEPPRRERSENKQVRAAAFPVRVWLVPRSSAQTLSIHRSRASFIRMNPLLGRAAGHSSAGLPVHRSVTRPRLVRPHATLGRRSAAEAEDVPQTPHDRGLKRRPRGARRDHRVVDIAAQAGLSRATVDRVLHGREGIRAETVAQVRRAIDELERQQQQVHLSGRTLIVDLVMQTPERFAVASRNALESELRSLRPAVLRARSHLSEHSDPAAIVGILDGMRRKDSHGVILKAPDDPRVAEAVDRLAGRGIPAVTFVTDVPRSRRAAYVGMDNA